MKIYIKASFDSSMPEWLKGQDVLGCLKKKYALHEAKFYNEPQSNSITIYLLEVAYKNTTKRNWRTGYKYTTHTKVTNYAWYPECSEDISILVNDTYYRPTERNLKYKSVKSTLDSLIKYQTYMVAPLRSEVRSEHYEDPRDMSNSSYPRRDKSGYIIPSPLDLYEKLYAKFPDMADKKLGQIIDKMDQYYDILNECKDKIFDIDIRNGRGYDTGLGNVNRPKVNIFNDAVRHYGWAYQELKELTDSVANDAEISSESLTSLMAQLTVIGDKIDNLKKELS